MKIPNILFGKITAAEKDSTVDGSKERHATLYCHLVVFQGGVFKNVQQLVVQKVP